MEADAVGRGGAREDRGEPDDLLRELLACPVCHGSLTWDVPDECRCLPCAISFPIVRDIPVVVAGLTDPHKQQQAAHFDGVESDFEVTRPSGTPRLHRWLLQDKFRRSIAGLRTPLQGATVLTVCGGSGMDGEFLARQGARVIVSDISLEAAGRARLRAHRSGLGMTSVVADIEALPFCDRSFDLVYVHDGLHHLERPAAGMAEMARVAAAAVSINEPAKAAATRLAVHARVAEDVEEAGNRIERLDPGVLAADLEAAGFTVVRSERYAMLYRHEPGPAMRLFSAPALYELARCAIAAFNAIAGRFGNKMTIQARR
jgi:SAM-dependent methyltransferase